MVKIAVLLACRFVSLPVTEEINVLGYSGKILEEFGLLDNTTHVDVNSGQKKYTYSKISNDNIKGP